MSDAVQFIRSGNGLRLNYRAMPDPRDTALHCLHNDGYKMSSIALGARLRGS